MSDCTITRELESGRAVLRVRGVVDRDSARTLGERIARDGAAELLLDVTLVREFSDLGVAALATALQKAPGRVVFRGLRQHQLRMFRYCGLLVGEVSPREALFVAGSAAAEAAAG